MLPLMHGVQNLRSPASHLKNSDTDLASSRLPWVADSPLSMVGRRVKVMHLRTTESLNGLHGHIIHFDYSKGRYHVKLGGPGGPFQIISLKPINLELDEAKGTSSGPDSEAIAGVA